MEDSNMAHKALNTTMALLSILVLATTLAVAEEECPIGKEEFTGCDGIYCIKPRCPSGFAADCRIDCAGTTVRACVDGFCECIEQNDGGDDDADDPDLPDFGTKCNVATIDTSNLQAYYETYADQLCTISEHFRRYVGRTAAEPRRANEYEYYSDSTDVQGEVLSSYEEALGKAISHTVTAEDRAIHNIIDFVKQYRNVLQLAEYTQEGCGGSCQICMANALDDPCTCKDDLCCSSQPKEFCDFHLNCYWSGQDETCKLKCGGTDIEQCGAFDCSGFLKPNINSNVVETVPEGSTMNDVCGLGPSAKHCTWDWTQDTCINLCEQGTKTGSCTGKPLFAPHPDGYPQIESYCAMYDEGSKSATLRIEYSWDNFTYHRILTNETQFGENMIDFAFVPATNCSEGVTITGENVFTVPRLDVCSDLTNLEETRRLDFAEEDVLVLESKTYSKEQQNDEEAHCLYFELDKGAVDMQFTYDFATSTKRWLHGMATALDGQTPRVIDFPEDGGTITTKLVLPIGVEVTRASFDLEGTLTEDLATEEDGSHGHIVAGDVTDEACHGHDITVGGTLYPTGESCHSHEIADGNAAGGCHTHTVTIAGREYTSSEDGCHVHTPADSSSDVHTHTYTGIVSAIKSLSADFGNDGADIPAEDLVGAKAVEDDAIAEALTGIVETCTCSGCSVSEDGKTCSLDVVWSAASKGRLSISDMEFRWESSAEHDQGVAEAQAFVLYCTDADPAACGGLLTKEAHPERFFAADALPAGVGMVPLTPALPCDGCETEKDWNRLTITPDDVNALLGEERVMHSVMVCAFGASNGKTETTVDGVAWYETEASIELGFKNILAGINPYRDFISRYGKEVALGVKLTDYSGTEACTDGAGLEPVRQSIGFLSEADADGQNAYPELVEEDGVFYGLGQVPVELGFVNIMDNALFPRLEIVASLLSDDNIAKNRFANRKIDVDSRAIVSGQSVACGYHPLKPTYEDIPDDITQLTDGVIMEVGNGWRSLVADNGNWIQVDLEEPLGISGLRLYAFKLADDVIMKPGNFEIHVSNDTEVYELVDEYIWELDAEETLVVFDQPITARYVAVVVVTDVINGQFATNTDQVVDEDGDIVLATGETVSEAQSGLSEIEIFSIRSVADDIEAFVKLADGTKKLLERYSPTAWAFDEEAFLAFNASSAVYLASPTSTQMIDTALLMGVDPETTEYTCPGGEGAVLPAALLEPTGGAGKRKVVMHEFPLDLSAFRLYDLELSYWSGREHCEVDLEECEVFNSTRETEILILDNAVYVDTVDEPFSIGLGNGTGIDTGEGLFEISVSDTAVYPGEFIEVFVRFTPSTETTTEKILFSTRLDNVTDDLMADGFRNLLHFRMDKEEVKKRVQISGCFWADIVSVQITSHMTDDEEDALSALQEEFGTSAIQTRERLGGIVKGVPYNATFTFRASTLHNNGARSDLPHTWLLRADVFNSFLDSDGRSFLPKEVVIPIRIYKEGLEDKEEESCVPGCLGDQLISLEVCKGLSLLCTHYIRDFFAMTTILKDYYIKAQNALDDIDEFALAEDAFLNIREGTTGLERGPSRPVDLNLEVPALKRVWTDQIIDKERISKWLSDVMLGLARGQQSATVGEMDTRETLAFWDKMMPENQQWALERYEVCKVKMKSLGKFSCLEFDGFKKMKENSREAFEAARTKYGVPYNQLMFWNGIQRNLEVTFDPIKKENKPKEVFEACIDADCGVKQQTLALDDGADVVLSGTRLTLQSTHRDLPNEVISFVSNLDPTELEDIPRQISVDLFLRSRQATLFSENGVKLAYPPLPDVPSEYTIPDHGVIISFSRSNILIEWEQGLCEKCELWITTELGNWTGQWYVFDLGRFSAVAKGYEELVREERARQWARMTPITYEGDEPLRLEEIMSFFGFMSTVLNDVCVVAQENAQMLARGEDIAELHDISNAMSRITEKLPDGWDQLVGEVVRGWAANETVHTIMNLGDPIVDQGDVLRADSIVKASNDLLGYMCMQTIRTKEGPGDDDSAFTDLSVFADHWDCSRLSPADCGQGLSASYCAPTGSQGRCAPLTSSSEMVFFADPDSIDPIELAERLAAPSVTSVTVLSPECLTGILLALAERTMICEDIDSLAARMGLLGCTRQRTGSCVDDEVIESVAISSCKMDESGCSPTTELSPDHDIWMVSCTGIAPVRELEIPQCTAYEMTIDEFPEELSNNAEGEVVVTISLTETQPCMARTFAIDAAREEDVDGSLCRVSSSMPIYFSLGGEGVTTVTKKIAIRSGSEPGVCRLEVSVFDGAKTTKNIAFPVVPTSEPDGECAEGLHKENGVCCAEGSLCCENNDQCANQNTCTAMAAQDLYYVTNHCDTESNRCIQDDAEKWVHCSATGKLCESGVGCVPPGPVNVIDMAIDAMIGDEYRRGEEFPVFVDVLDDKLDHITGATVTVTVGDSSVTLTEDPTLGYTTTLKLDTLGEHTLKVTADKEGNKATLEKTVTIYTILDLSWTVDPLSTFAGDQVIATLNAVDGEGQPVTDLKATFTLDGNEVQFNEGRVRIPADVDIVEPAHTLRACVSKAYYRPVTSCAEGESCCRPKIIFVDENPFQIEFPFDDPLDPDWPEPGIDTDGDGMDDGWEKYYGVSDPAADPDLDGLSNLQEFQRRTNPTKWDTDDDGYSDLDEVESGTNPLDPISRPPGAPKVRIDDDNDGMDDGWEKQHGVSDPAEDPDLDGLTNLDEFKKGTKPTVWDSDSDGFSDGNEVDAGTDPIDPKSRPPLPPVIVKDDDGDGMDDGWEKHYDVDDPAADPDMDGLNNLDDFLHGTDPGAWDSDGDGYSDGHEVEAGTDPIDPRSRPVTPPKLQKDEDGDGMDDGWESFYGVTDPAGDPDLDGLTNLQEFQQGTYPTTWDSDGDGYSDQDEAERGTDPVDRRSHPTGAPTLRVDEDNDGMDDGWERMHGVDDPSEDADLDGLSNLEEFQYGTNPTSWDTDGDGYSDKEEVKAGTDPVDPASRPLDFRIVEREAFFIGDDIPITIRSKRAGTVSCSSAWGEEPAQELSCTLEGGRCTMNFKPDRAGVLTIACNAFGIEKKMQVQVCDPADTSYCKNLPMRDLRPPLSFSLELIPTRLELAQGGSGTFSVKLANTLDSTATIEVQVAMPENLDSSILGWNAKSVSIDGAGERAEENSVTIPSDLLFGEYSATIRAKSGVNSIAKEVTISVKYDVDTLQDKMDEFETDLSTVESTILELQRMEVDPMTARLYLRKAIVSSLQMKRNFNDQRYVVAEEKLEEGEGTLDKAKREAELAKELVSISPQSRNLLPVAIGAALVVGALSLMMLRGPTKKRP